MADDPTVSVVGVSLAGERVRDGKRGVSQGFGLLAHTTP